MGRAGTSEECTSRACLRGGGQGLVRAAHLTRDHRGGRRVSFVLRCRGGAPLGALGFCASPPESHAHGDLVVALDCTGFNRYFAAGRDSLVSQDAAARRNVAAGPGLFPSARHFKLELRLLQLTGMF